MSWLSESKRNNIIVIVVFKSVLSRMIRSKIVQTISYNL